MLDGRKIYRKVLKYSMKIISKLKNWLIVLPMIPVAVGGVSKGIDILKHDIIGLPKNSEERHIQHLVKYHFNSNETPKSATIDRNDGSKIIIQDYSDGCTTMKKISKEGLPSGFKIIPESEKEENFGWNDNNIVYAGKSQKLNLGSHRDDLNYKEKMIENKIERTYGDGCVLIGFIDEYGNVNKWEWIKYKHK